MAIHDEIHAVARAMDEAEVRAEQGGWTICLDTRKQELRIPGQNFKRQKIKIFCAMTDACRRKVLREI